MNDGVWRLANAQAVSPIATAADATLEARAIALKERVAAPGELEPSVILALPSAWCLSATVSTDDLDVA